MRFVVCGEALIDLMPGGQRSGWSETPWRALCGGGPMNTAVALARLGCPVEFLGRFGADSFASQLRGHIAGSGAGLSLAAATSEATSIAVVSLDEQGKASYTFHFDKTANFGWQDEDFPELSRDDWLHFGSIGAIIMPGHEALLRFLERTEAGMSYDINVRLSVLPDREEYYRRVSAMMTAVGRRNGVVKASDEDLQLLLGDPGADVVQVASGWVQDYGLGLFVVTLGPDGAVAVTPEGDQFRVPGKPICLVDTVGAGDTFMAGFLSRYANDRSQIAEALQRGIGASAIVCTRKGANPPTAEELEAYLVQP